MIQNVMRKAVIPTAIRHRPLKMDDWGISFDAYKELYHFCQQYNDKKREAESLLMQSTQSGGEGLPHGKGGVSDPVSRAAIRREVLLRDVAMIEQAAIGADAQLYPYILRAVTTKDGMRSISPPCGERQFRAARRRFFYLLWQMKNGRL
jgi:hypothetical protein